MLIPKGCGSLSSSCESSEALSRRQCKKRGLAPVKKVKKQWKVSHTKRVSVAQHISKLICEIDMESDLDEYETIAAEKNMDTSSSKDSIQNGVSISDDVDCVQSEHEEIEDQPGIEPIKQCRTSQAPH
ncbi:hypothetical protein FGB62_158g02 [Gracilaria domingensis]|nr:hypothetical protein FGB62_158g02 [Gracilaria domingensis]